MAAIDAASANGVSLAALCDACVRALGVDGAAFTLMTESQPQGAVFGSDAIAVTTEDLQFTLGEGPGVEAYRSGSPVLVEELSRESSRWPELVLAAGALGVHALFAFPVQVGDVKLGVLSMYRTRAGPLAASNLADMLTVVATVTQIVLTMQSEITGEMLSWRLSEAADHRAGVHQASGMISAQLNCGVDEALVRLRAHAYAEDQSVDDVARRVIDRDLRFDR